ncbi:hypothetical protein SD70_15375 [Gordoniibacillus kamchatkensis]|uniref:histidine kinase n=1 Tax=Gordoniibacillus kamchatkensis TaxID=1590651 RepID=A0ABR5AGN1_9BACL|nr:response regulator [Paenibacillus sp. VKM B-2647]KIL40194.1 hypothetical protein SD70_15375 [Paenibacillus sp. VKM B-2647]
MAEHIHTAAGRADLQQLLINAKIDSAASAAVSAHIPTVFDGRALTGEFLHMANLIHAAVERLGERDWLQTNLVRLGNMLQRQRDTATACNLILSELAALVPMQHGLFYVCETEREEPVLKLIASHGYQVRKTLANRFRRGEGLVGQCLLEKQRIVLTNVPEDYVNIGSGSGEMAPLNIVLLPILSGGQVLAVIEIASSRAFSPAALEFLDRLAESIGNMLATLQAGNGTEGPMAEELRKQCEQLRRTNEELEQKVRLLEEQVEQLALTSNHKSEFLPGISHELLTPLHSLLILSWQLAENAEGNLTDTQVRNAKMIHESGHDLLAMINDILGLSKFESDAAKPVYEELPPPDVPAAYPAKPDEPVKDDRYAIAADDRVLLIADYDPQFAETLLQAARKKGFKGIVTLSGESAFELASRYRPAAIAIDTYLEDGNGLVVLDRLKQSAATRNIPVWIMSIGSERLSFLQRGAVECLTKPAADGELSRKVDDMMERAVRPQRRVIVWCESGERVRRIVSALELFDIRVTETVTEAEFIDTVRMLQAGCIVVDWATAGASASGLDEIMRGAKAYDVPLLFYTELPWTQAEDERLHALARSFVVKKAASPHDLAFEASLYLPLKDGASLQSLFDSQPARPVRSAQGGRKVLVIDDDIRSVFAITSLLERHAVSVIPADNGKEALQLLQENRDIDAVLVDIVMPVLDGYETIAAIRSMPAFRELPVIALTAKAMPGEREKCLAAGATDYLAKPADTDELIASLHKWLPN